LQQPEEFNTRTMSIRFNLKDTIISTSITAGRGTNFTASFLGKDVHSGKIVDVKISSTDGAFSFEANTKPEESTTAPIRDKKAEDRKMRTDSPPTKKVAPTKTFETSTNATDTSLLGSDEESDPFAPSGRRFDAHLDDYITTAAQAVNLESDHDDSSSDGYEETVGLSQESFGATIRREAYRNARHARSSGRRR
jgi:hypothetical protein